MSLDDLKKRIKSLNNQRIKIGWFKEATYDGKTPVAQVALWNEHGHTAKVTEKMRGWFGAHGVHLRKDTTHISVPPRPFLRPCCDDNREKWKQEMGNAVQAVIQGNVSVQSACEMLGGMVAGDLQESISKVRQPPLSPVTVGLRASRKGGETSDQPLNDTGYMIATVTYKVNDES